MSASPARSPTSSRWCMRNPAAPGWNRSPARRRILPRFRAAAALRRAADMSARNAPNACLSSWRFRPRAAPDACLLPPASGRGPRQCRSDQWPARIMTTDLTHLSVAAAGKMLRAREISPVELVDAFLARIERVDARIKSYLLVTAEAARARAKDAEAQIMAGGWRGPLHGIPYGAKDTFHTKGLRTCANSHVLMQQVPDHDAAIIEKLDAAGAILLESSTPGSTEPGLGSSITTPLSRIQPIPGRRIISPAAPRPAPAPRSPPAPPCSRSAPTPAAPFARRRPAAALPASSPPTAV